MDYQDDYTQAEEYQAPEVEEVTRYSPAWIKFFLEDFNFLRRPNVTDENAGKAIKALLRFWETLEPLTPEEEGPDGLIAMMIDTPLARIKKGSSALYRQCLINALNAYGVKAGSKTPTRDLERMVSQARAEAERQREATEREKAEAAEAEREAAKAKKEAAKKKRQAEREAEEQKEIRARQKKAEIELQEAEAAQKREQMAKDGAREMLFSEDRRASDIFRMIRSVQAKRSEIEAWTDTQDADQKRQTLQALAALDDAAAAMPTRLDPNGSYTADLFDEKRISYTEWRRKYQESMKKALEFFQGCPMTDMLNYDDMRYLN